MRLGVDLDGTVADMQGALFREAARLFPEVDPASVPQSTPSNESTPAEEGPPAEADPTRSLTARQQRVLWDSVRGIENFWETLDEIEPGALARLFRLGRERRWEIIFLTSRPETAGDTAQAQSHRWLAAHGFSSPSVFVVHGSRGKIAAALHLDVFIDDRPENCLDIAVDSNARAVLVWRGDENNVPASARQLGIGTVRSVAEAFDTLEALDSEPAGAPGIVERFRNLFGLKSRPVRSRSSEPLPSAVGVGRGR